jgi:hypothetical protein
VTSALICPRWSSLKKYLANIKGGKISIYTDFLFSEGRILSEIYIREQRQKATIKYQKALAALRGRKDNGRYNRAEEGRYLNMKWPSSA